MTRPHTTIDRRYSDPSAEPTPWEETERILLTAQLSWLTTVRADGRPHVTPVVAAWVDGSLFFHTSEGEQKYNNLTANPNVVVTTGDATWDHGIDVIVEGRAVRELDETVLQRVADANAAKWDGRWVLEVRDGHFVNRGTAEVTAGAGSEVFRVDPTKIFAQAKGVFGQTRYTFG